MHQPAVHRVSFVALAVLLLVAFAVGGGGSRFGLANLAVQFTALVVLAVRGGAVLAFWRESPLALRLLVATTLLLPLLQVVPLPEHIWTALPGRDLVARSFEAAGQNGWMTVSTDPQRTVLALSALIAPLAVLMVGWSMPHRDLLLLAWLVVLCGLVTMLMGIVQLNPAGENFTLFGSRDPGRFLLGTFANRNSTALLLVFCLALACLLPPPRPHPAVLPLRLALCALLLVAVLLTKSRTGLVLAAIPLCLAAIKGAVWMTSRSSAHPGKMQRFSPVMIAAGATALGVMAIGGLLVAAPGRIGETLERFEAKDDPRRFIWEDAVFAMDRYWPVGAGMGTFDEVFQIDESLENVTFRTAGRAHNDYLELAIEAGLAGIAVAVLWIALCLMMARQAHASSMAWTGWAGGAFLLAIALQSITDYPLRNQTILVFGAVALLLLARTAADPERRRR